MEVKLVPIDTVIPYSRNPRKNDNAVAAVAASIKEFGFHQPIVVDKEMVVIVGHTRLAAAKRLNMFAVPVEVASGLTAAQVQAYRIADNRTAEIAEWDYDKLRLEISELQSVNYDVAVLAFPLQELKEILFPRNEDDKYFTGDDDVPDFPKEPVTRRGDVYVMGEHRLMCGDSTSAEDFATLMDGKEAAMCWTDPPYNVEIVGGNHSLSPEQRKAKGGKSIKNDAMTDDEFDIFLAKVHANINGALIAGGGLYVAHADSYGLAFRKAFAGAGMLLKQCLVWVKNSMVMGRQDYQWKHEPILYGWKPGAGHKWYGDRKHTTVLEFDRPSRSSEHPTMKPVALVEYCLRNSSAPDDIVLDPFGGSGTTLIACEKTGRFARLMELDPAYCDVIVERWQKKTGQTAVMGD